MKEYFVRFGSNSNWSRCMLNSSDVKDLKAAGYHVFPVNP